MKRAVALLRAGDTCAERAEVAELVTEPTVHDLLVPGLPRNSMARGFSSAIIDRDLSLVCQTFSHANAGQAGGQCVTEPGNEEETQAVSSAQRSPVADAASIGPVGRDASAFQETAAGRSTEIGGLDHGPGHPSLTRLLLSNGTCSRAASSMRSRSASGTYMAASLIKAEIGLLPRTWLCC